MRLIADHDWVGFALTWREDAGEMGYHRNANHTNRQNFVLLWGTDEGCRRGSLGRGERFVLMDGNKWRIMTSGHEVLPGHQLIWRMLVYHVDQNLCGR